MKKFMYLFVVVCALCLLSAPAFAAPVKLRFAHSEATSNIRHDVCLFFAKRVAELSKDQVQVEVFPAGVLGTHQSCQEEVSMGTIDFYPSTAGLVSVFDPKRSQELLELPYLFDTPAQAYAFMDSDYAAKIYEPLQARGIRVLATWDNGFRNLTNNVRAVSSPADMKGMKIRVVQSEMSIKILNALGASGVPMSYSELYTAMASGVVDGQENPVMNIFASKFFEVQKFMSMTRHQYSTLPLLISEATWQRKLNDEQRKAVLQAAKEAAPYFRRKVVSQEDGQKEAMVKAGLAINDVADFAPFRKAVEPVYAWAAEKWGKDRVDELRAEVDKIRAKYPVGTEYFGDEK